MEPECSLPYSQRTVRTIKYKSEQKKVGYI